MNKKHQVFVILKFVKYITFKFARSDPRSDQRKRQIYRPPTSPVRLFYPCLQEELRELHVAFGHVSSGLKGLVFKQVTVLQTSGVPVDDLKIIVENFPFLQRLKLDSCTSFPPNMYLMLHYIKQMKHLEGVKLYSCGFSGREALHVHHCMHKDPLEFEICQYHFAD